MTCDNVTEGVELFNLALTITSGSAGVTLGKDICVGQIVDSTGKKRTYVKFLLLIRMFNSCSKLQQVIIWSNGRWLSKRNDIVE